MVLKTQQQVVVVEELVVVLKEEMNHNRQTMRQRILVEALEVVAQ